MNKTAEKLQAQVGRMIRC